VDDRPFVGNRRELACSFSIGLTKSLDLDAGSRDDLAPLGDINRYDRSEFFRRITDHVDALFLELVGCRAILGFCYVSGDRRRIVIPALRQETSASTTQASSCAA
jgi:hypothetical protein